VARLFDSELELRALFTLLNGREIVRQNLLAKVGEEHFGHPLSQEILRATYRIIKNRQRKMDMVEGKRTDLPIPSSTALQGAPGISDEAKIILAKPRDALESKADLEEVLRNLEFYRKIRVVHRESKAIIHNMRGSVDRIDLNLVRDRLIAAVEGIQDYDAARSVSVLRGKEGRDLAKQALRKHKLIPTGFKNYDDRGGGFEIGDLLMCAAPTGGGKSVMLLTLGIHLYLFCNKSVCIPTFELSKPLYVSRLIAHVCGVKFDDIRRGTLSKQDRKLVKKMYDEFMAHGPKNNCQFAIMEPGNASAEELGLALKPYGFDVIIPDHMLHIRATKGDNDATQLGHVARACKDQAMNNKQIWISAVQLDDETQKIRYSKMMKEETDTAWAWVGEEGTDVVKVKSLKARNHEPFDFFLQKDFKYMAFRDSEGPPSLSKDDDDIASSMDQLPE
jgi:hypothetical protein